MSYVLAFYSGRDTIRLNHSAHGLQVWQECTLRAPTTCAISFKNLRKGLQAWRQIEGGGVRSLRISINEMNRIKNAAK